MSKFANMRVDLRLLRVLSMIFILLCHLVNFISWLPGNRMLGELFQVGVEIFFLLSGYLYGKKSIESFRPWYRKRMQRVALPVLFLVIVDLLALVLIYDVKYSLLTMIVYLLNLQGLLFINWAFFRGLFEEVTNLGPLWFVTVIMFCYAAVPLLQRIRSRFKAITIWVGLSGAVIIRCILFYFTGTELLYFIIFSIGYFFAAHEKPVSISNAMIMAVVGLGAMVLRLILHIGVDGTTLYLMYVPIGQTCLALAVFYLVLTGNRICPKLYRKLEQSRVLEVLDHSSFYIYLTHGLFCMGVTSVFGLDIPRWLQFIFFTVLTSICSILLQKITEAVQHYLINRELS